MMVRAQPVRASRHHNSRCSKGNTSTRSSTPPRPKEAKLNAVATVRQPRHSPSRMKINLRKTAPAPLLAIGGMLVRARLAQHEALDRQGGGHGARRHI